MRLPWRRADRNAELDEEINGHLAMAARDHEARGESPTEAAYAARREFGNGTLVKEVTRSTWGGVWLDHLLRDVRFALRSLARRPAYAAAAVLCFALGIGANLAMFGVLDTLLFKAPPHVRDAERVVRLYFNERGGGSASTSFLAYQDLAAGVPALSAVGAIWRMDAVVGRGVAAEKAHAALVSSSYLSLLYVQPSRGRLFGPDEDRAGGDRVAVLSGAYAQRLFGSDSGAVGRFLTVGTAPYAVVGVVPADFTGAGLEPVDLWLPLSVASPDLFSPHALADRHSYWLEVIGRLRPGLGLGEAAAQASLVWRRSQTIGRRDSTGAFVRLGPIQGARSPLGSGRARLATRLGALSVILLLIACANVANLLLARGMARRQEIAVRIALGAGRRGLLQQSFVESVLLAAAGGVVALIVALWAGELVGRYVLPAGAGLGAESARVFVYAAMLSLIVGLVSGSLPALQASRSGLADDLKAGTPRGSTRRSRAQTGLLVTQVALTLILVAGAGLFVRSLRNVLNVDPGYDIRNVLVASVDFRGTGYKSDRINDTYRTLLDRARTIPGVEAAAFTQAGPLDFFFGASVEVPGRGVLRPDHGTYFQSVSSDYFKTMGSRLIRGRGIDSGDGAGAPKVVVMGEAMARLAFPDADPLGKCIMLNGGTACRQVVGVVEDAKQWSVTEPAYPILYTPFDQDSGNTPTALYVRSRTPARMLLPAVRRDLQAMDPGGPFVDVRSLDMVMEEHFRPWRLGATVLGLFAALAMLLSGLGLYGVLAYVVGQRTREIGVRVALGADRSNLFALVLGEGLRVVAAGVVLGVLASLALSKLVASLLFGVSPRDPWVMAASAGVLFAAAILACVIPARRAATVDPMAALRYE